MTQQHQNLCRTLFAAAAVTSLARSAAADTVVQVPVDGIIDGRSVSTLSNNTVVPWTVGQGVDGDGNGDGYVTNATEAVLQTQGKTVNNQIGVALPDDGVFAADQRHPEIDLHFSNAADSTSPQTHQIYISQGPQTMTLPVPPATYSKMFLILTASEGAANLTITLTYAGAAPVTTNFQLPDYGVGGAQANDPVYFNLIAGMRKWTSSNQEGDGPSHTITGIEINPSATDTLSSIEIQKTNGSHVVFWGATGIATSAVDVGTGGAGGTAGTSGTDGGINTEGGSGGASEAGGTGGTAVGGTGGDDSLAASGAAGDTSATGGSSGEAPGGSSDAESGSSSGGSAGSSSTKKSHSSGGCSLSSSTQSNNGAWASLLTVGALVLLRRRRA